MKVIASHCKESFQGAIARSHCKESLQGVMRVIARCKEPSAWSQVQVASAWSQVQVASARSQVQLTCEELKSLLRAAGECRRHLTKIDPLRGLAWSRCKNSRCFAMFLGPRDPLRGSAWSRCKTRGFLRFCWARATLSAGIGVVEVEKLEVFCGVRATLCGDRRGRGAKTRGFFYDFCGARTTLCGDRRGRSAKTRFFDDFCSARATLCGDQRQKLEVFCDFCCSVLGIRALLPAPVGPWSAGGLRKLRGATCIEQLAQSNLRRASCTDHFAQSNLRRATCTDQFAQSTLPRATCAEQLTQSNLHRDICTETVAQRQLHRASCTACTEQLAQSNLHRATCAEQLAQTSLRKAPCPEQLAQNGHGAVMLSGQPWSSQGWLI